MTRPLAFLAIISFMAFSSSLGQDSRQQTLASPPIITSFSPTSGPIGTTVTIIGSNFSTTPSNNIVYFGAVKATATAATSTSISVTVPAGAAYAPITVTDATTGLTGYSGKSFVVTFPSQRVIDASSFAAKVDFAAGNTPHGVAIADLDGDGKPDLAIANEVSNSVSLLRNTSTNGSITSNSFAPKVDFTTGGSAKRVAIGDLDGDGKPDLAVTNGSNNTVSVFRNTSTIGTITVSSFAARVDFSTGVGPGGVGIGDVDGDGKPELAVANYTGNSLSVFRNVSTMGNITLASFAAKVDFTTGTNPNAIAIEDLDNDGKRDLVVVGYGSNSVSVFRNTSTSGSITLGSLSPKVDFITGSSPNDVAIGDVDADGKPDIAVVNVNSAAVSIFRNTSATGTISSGSFSAKVDFTTGTQPSGIAMGDFDGDGKPDLVVANEISNTVSVFRNTSVTGSITSSSFAPKVDFATGIYPYLVAIGDLDGDGKLDIAATNYSANTVSVFRNTIATLPSPLLGEYLPDANTVLLMHMNETSGATVNDASSYGNNGTATGATAVAGKFGKARSFSGANEYVQGTANQLSFATGDFTLEAWIRTSVTTGQVIFATSSSEVGLYLGGGGRLDLDINNGAGSSTNSTGKSVSDSRWHHVAAVRTGNKGYLYIDGVLDFTENLTQNPGSSTSYRVGAIASTYFNGLIDELRISNKARSPQEFNLQLGPKSLSASVSGSTINLIWQNGGGAVGLLRYKIYRGIDSTNVSVIDSTLSTSYSNAGLSPATTYYYRVSAVDSTGFEGAKSWAASAVALGLVAYYPFNDNANDASANANHGTVNGALRSTDRFGNANKAMSFNGQDQYIDVPDHPSLNPTSQLTLSVWLKSSTIHVNSGIVAKWNQHGGGGQEQYALTAINDNVNVHLRNDSGVQVDLSDGTSYSDGLWHNFVVTWDASSIRFYRDGMHLESAPFAGKLPWYLQKLEIGRYARGQAGVSNYFKGSIDDIRIYNRALSASEIDSLYHEGGYNPPPASPTNLVATAGNGQVSLKWNKVPDTDLKRYRIYRGISSPANTLFDSTAAGNLNDTTRIITGLTNGTAYFFRVTAVDSAGNESAYSNEASATPSSPTSGLVQVTGGTFQMGSTSGEPDEIPVHPVTLSAFNIDKTEVTYEKWTEVRNWGLTHGYTDLPAGRNGYYGTTNHPVTEVSWYDMLKWCNARSERDGLTPAYYTSNTLSTVYRAGQLDLAADAVKWNAYGYRLPTEGEWEFAAKGGTKSHGYTYSGSNTRDSVAWYLSNSGNNTHPVSTKGANELGLYDMSGNVWEWCWDWYGTYSASAQTDPKGPTLGTIRVLRGLSFVDTDCRVEYRNHASNIVPTYRGSNLGFRCVQTDSTQPANPIPAAPQNLAATAGNGQVSLRWNKVPDTDLKRYRIYRGTASPAITLVDSTSAGNLNDTTKTISGLTNGTTYYSRVTAVDSAGNESGYSNEVSATPQAAARLVGEYTPDANTVLLMHMNESSGSTVNDASSYGNNGTATGATAVDGRFGKARSFNGRGDYVNVLNGTSLKTVNEITLEAWIQPRDLLTDQHIISTAGNGPSRYGHDYYLKIDGKAIEFRINDDPLVTPQIQIDTTKWHHIAAIYSQALGTRSIYVDGFLFAQDSYSSLINTGHTSLTLGVNARNVALGEALPYFRGMIDEVRICNKARSPQEFNLQLPPKNLTASVSGTTINLTWQNGGGAVPLMRYKIYRGTDSTKIILIDSTLSTSYSNAGLSPATTYCYRVSAVDSTGFEGAKSYAASATPSSPATDLVQVAGGTFQMGSNDANDYGASPPHSVTLGAFYIDKTEITYEKWTEVRNWGLAHGYSDLPAGGNGYHGTTNHPVTEVSWYDILKWCNARSEKDGLTPVYYTSNTLSIVCRTGQLDLAANAVQWTANGYRLPTEAEWEFAARGGTKSQGYTYSGSNTIDGVAWYSVSSGDNTHPVSTKGANELGLYDMSGNVMEWCWDWYGAYGPSAQTDPKGPTSGTYRMLRGGSFSDGVGDRCRVAYRYNYLPNQRYLNFAGFRCVQTDSTQPANPIPAAPQNLLATAGNGQVSLKWNKVPDTDLKRYRIYRSTASPAIALIDSTTAGNLNDTTKSITGLTNGTVYYFRVTAVDSAGNESGYSNEVSATPQAPARLVGEYTPDANTVLLMHMNESSGSTVNDASSYGNHGTATGTTIADGKSGKARRFDDQSRIDVPPSISINIGAFDFTIETWVKSSTPDVMNQMYSKRGLGGLQGTDLVITSAGLLRFRAFDAAGTGIDLYSQRRVDDYKWHHIAVVRQGVVVYLYIDGAFDGSVNIAAAGNLLSGSPLTFGQGWKFIVDFFIDEVRISNVARSPQEFNLQLPPKNLSASASGTSISLTWQNGGGAVPLLRYKIYRGTDSTNVALVDSTTSTSRSNAGLSPATTYYYRVSAVDSTGFEGAKSYATSATTASAPSAPTLTSPADGATGVPVSPTLSWGVAAGATSYRLQVSTNSTFATIVFDDATLTATSRQVGPLLNNTVYYWRVSAANAAGTSSYSATRNFTTIIQAPDIVSLTSPSDGATNQLVSLLLSWSPAARAATYRLQISTSSTFASFIADDSTLTNTSYQTPSLANGTLYYWRVAAKNAGGVSAWSTQRSFTTVFSVLVAPTLITPLDSDVNVSVSLILNWNAVSGATSYRLQVSAASDFASTVVDQSGLTTTSRTVTGLANGTKYYWRVSASNAAGTGPYSATRGFTTIVSAPAAPVLASPGSGSSNQPTTITLSWNASTGTTIYRLQVSQSSTFASTIVNDSTLTAPSKQIGPLSFGTTYYWRVSASNIGGSSSYSLNASFTTIPAPATTLTVNASVSFPSRQKQQDYATSDYRLFGLPGGIIAASTVLGGTPVTDWQMCWDNGASSNYQVVYDGSSTFQFGNGRAFWLLSKTTLVITRMVNGPSQNQTYEVEIPLHAGWNMITNPFTTAIPWSRVQAANGTTGTIQTYSGSWAIASSFDQCVGYYFFNGSPQLPVLKVPYYSLYGDVGEPPGKAFDGWKVSVVLNSDGVTSGETIFGVSAGADQALDEFDIRRPRALGAINDVYFERPEWDYDYPTFGSDIRATMQQTEEWNFKVSAEPNRPSTLTFTGMQDIPAEYEVFLLDKSSGKSASLRRNSSYAFVSPLRTMEFTVVVGTKEGVLKKASELLPTEFSISQNFPNPFNPTTSVRVTVPVRSQIRLTIFNLLGQRVSTLYEGVIDAGISWYTWNGKDEHQSDVTSGVYFCRLETDGGRPSIVRMILMK